MPRLIKQLVTNIQLFQFFTMLFQAGYLLFFDCPYPKRVTMAYFVYICTLVVLFLDFSKKTYSKGSSKATPKTPSKTPSKGGKKTN